MSGIFGKLELPDEETTTYSIMLIRRLTILLLIVGCEMPTQTNDDDIYRGSIDFGLPTASDVNIKVHDILGNEVAIIFDGFLEAGSYSFHVDLQSKSTGIYYASASIGDKVVIMHKIK